MFDKKTFPSLDQVWIFVAIVLIALRPFMTPIPPHDFWWHLATGKDIVLHASVPTVDSFSYTQAGQPFYNQGWLAQSIMYLVYALGELEMIIVFQSFVIALTYGLLLWLTIRRSGSVRLSVAVLLLLIMPVSFDNWNVRPQSYAFPIFVAFLYILWQWRNSGTKSSPQKQQNDIQSSSQWQYKNAQSSPKLWLLPILMIIWVNLHGSFVLGGVLIALTFVGEWVRRIVYGFKAQKEQAAKKKQLSESEQDAIPEPVIDNKIQDYQEPSLKSLFKWGAITALTLLINPRGVGVLSYVFNLLNTSAVTNLVTEWAPPTIRDTNGALFFLFLIFCGVVFAYTRRAPDPIDVLIAIPFLWLALGASRNVVWFAMVMMPMLVCQMKTLVSESESEKSTKTGSSQSSHGIVAMNRVLMGIMVLLLIVASPWIKPSLGLPPEIGALVSEDTPVEAVEFMRDDPRGPDRLFHAMSYGSYLIWEFPSMPVFVDPRIELYPYEQWQDYMTLNAGYRVDELLDRYDIDGLLLAQDEQAGLIKVMRDHPAWDVRYEDEKTIYIAHW